MKRFFLIVILLLGVFSLNLNSAQDNFKAVAIAAGFGALYGAASTSIDYYLCPELSIARMQKNSHTSEALREIRELLPHGSFHNYRTINKSECKLEIGMLGVNFRMGSSQEMCPTSLTNDKKDLSYEDVFSKKNTETTAAPFILRGALRNAIRIAGWTALATWIGWNRESILKGLAIGTGTLLFTQASSAAIGYYIDNRSQNHRALKAAQYSKWSNENSPLLLTGLFGVYILCQ